MPFRPHISCRFVFNHPYATLAAGLVRNFPSPRLSFYNSSFDATADFFTYVSQSGDALERE